MIHFQIQPPLLLTFKTSEKEINFLPTSHPSVSENGFFPRESSCVFIFSGVLSSGSPILTREWKRLEGSRELVICLTWHLLAKFFHFLYHGSTF